MDLHEGQTMTGQINFISGGAEHTFTLPADADKVVFTNLSDYTSTAGGLPVSTWWKGLTTAAHAYQQQVIDSSAGASFNFVDAAANGFTSADTDGGVAARQCTISAVTQADPCNITHSAFTFQNEQIVRVTDLGKIGPSVAERGMDQINNNRYKVVVVDATHITLKDVISGEAIDSSAFTAYVSGGRLCLETSVLQLNNPQVGDYSVTPYVPNPYSYDPIERKLTAGTAVMGTDGDVFVIEWTKFGSVEDLGDVG